ncbi:penicilin amidase [Pseudomonas asplenii]|uniref:Acyl-homoserine lactone acylase QuiP n=1 Tax=Pseudomonas asplenii TaxID=53407 RepID=A0A0N0E3N5_9PSED|nr:penicillin acylase family protein [Pseudomonas fuscovaginae]KPA90315.1 penicilin amidase [Pseudomonas fuscovaginae]
MINKFPLLSRLLLIIILPLLIVLGIGLCYLHSSLPQAKATLFWRGHDPGAVTITRDAHGMPHIRGASDLAVFYAAGYAQAQDRLWQMEVQRRIAQGRLSEILGRGSVKQDAWFKTLGLYRAAGKAWESLSEASRASLLAYAEGVNAWISEQRALPPEFIAFGIKPQPWTPVDSLAWIKVFALNLSGNFDDEMQRYIASAYFNSDQINFLFSRHQDGGGTQSNGVDNAHVQALAAVVEGQRVLREDLNLGGKWLGSNAWVTAGRLAADGRPTLANDPHLGLSIPSWWYPVALEGEHLKSVGMSLIGLPVVVLGLNSDIAWGATSMTADVQDLYFETLDAKRPGQYLRDGRWEPLEVRTEEIQVKADFPAVLRTALEPVRLQVRSSVHGPIITAMDPALEAVASLRWVAFDDNDTTYEALLRLNYAKDWQAFKSALSLFVSPALNFLYADVQGNIGYQGAGRIPIRKNGHGLAPVSGETSEFEWEGYIPFNDMPQRFNPPEGYLVSANDDVTGADYPYFISSNWAPPGRALRIRQLIAESLERSGGLDLETHQRIQQDVMSLPALRMATALATLEGRTPRQSLALTQLRGWDGNMSLDSVPAAIFNVWMRHVVDRVFAAKARVPFNQRGHLVDVEALFARLSTDDVYAALDGTSSAWCDLKEKPRPCAAALYESLDLALDELEKLKGGDMSAWRWGGLQHGLYEHTPFSFIKPLNAIFERSVAAAGSTDTVNVSYYSFMNANSYVKHVGAGFRQVMSMGAVENSYSYMNSTGQSGSVLSAHYADMLTPFALGQYYHMTLRRDDVENNSESSRRHDAHQ